MLQFVAFLAELRDNEPPAGKPEEEGKVLLEDDLYRVGGKRRGQCPFNRYGEINV